MLLMIRPVVAAGLATRAWLLSVAQRESVTESETSAVTEPL